MHLQQHLDATYRGVARLFQLNKGTLKNQFEKLTCTNRAHVGQQKFDKEEEERIMQLVVELDDIGVLPRYHHVSELMSAIPA